MICGLSLQASLNKQKIYFLAIEGKLTIAPEELLRQSGVNL
jgi:hypothetical protein